MQHHRMFLLAYAGLAIFVLGVLLPPGSAGQIPLDTSRVTVTGVVYNQFSGAPIPGALIRFADTDIEARTGDDGHFVIGGLSRGTYQLEVDALGYRPIRAEIRMLRSGELNLALEAGRGPAPGVPRSRLVGRVVEMDGGDPVRGAEITLRGRGSSQISDGQGRFEIGELTPGNHSFSVRYLGRAPLEAEVQVPQEGTLDVEIRLAVKPVELAPMIVTVTARNSYLEDMGFYDRRDNGLSGTQFTRQTLMERDPRSLSEVLVAVPGVRVMSAGLGNFQVRMGRAISFSTGGAGCSPALFIDDVRSEIGWLQDLEPARVEALEVYSGANAPLRYNDACGVILVWTRRGGRERG